MSGTLIVSFLALLILSVPIAISMGAADVIAVFVSGRFPLETVFHSMGTGL